MSFTNGCESLSWNLPEREISVIYVRQLSADIITALLSAAVLGAGAQALVGGCRVAPVREGEASAALGRTQPLPSSSNPPTTGYS